MENSLLVIFGEIWPMTLYYSTGCLARYSTILIEIRSKFLYNISKCICIRKNYKNGEFSPSHEIWPMTLYYSTGCLARKQLFL